MPSSYKGYDFEIQKDERGTYIATHELYNGNSKFNEETRPTLVFDIYYREADGDIIIESVSDAHLHNGYTKISPHLNADGVHKYHAYRWSREKILNEKHDLKFVKSGNTYKIYSKRRDFDLTTVRDIITDITTNNGTKDLADLDVIGFSFPKSVALLSIFVKMCSSTKSDIFLDFFSGSATTAHAVMQLNAEDGGNRKYIMVQLPELTYEGEKEKYKDKNGIEQERYVIDTETKLPKVKKSSEALKAGFPTICEIGKERIRRAGKKIKEESPLTTQNLDTGFRVLKLDSSNMEDVYYAPAEVNQAQLSFYANNVKPDRTSEDLLFQTMLELGATLDSKIEKSNVCEKEIFNVADGYIVACFDSEVSDDVVKAIAQMQPLYAVLRDSSLANDSTATNFEQIFKTYSPSTTCKIL